MRAIAILLGVTFAVVVGFVVLLRTESFAGEERSAQVVEVDRELRTINVSGDGYNRGLLHGTQLKADIAEIVAKWKANTSAALGKDPDQVLREFFEYASFEAAIEKWTPDLMDEVRGIAKGSGQTFEDIFVLNLLDEFWVYIDRLDNHHCSGIGIPAQTGRATCIAQNMDLETYTDGYQVLMRIEGDDQTPEQLILTHAGLIVLNGMNEARIGVCVNTLMQLAAAPEGLPVAFVVRALLTRRDRDSVLQFIQEVDHASGQNYIIGIADEVFDFEASANKVVQFQPGNDNGTVYHTNHPLVNDDIKPWYDDPSKWGQNSQMRLATVESRLESNADVRTETIMEVLRSRDNPEHPVCRTHVANLGGFTFASTIMSLGESPSLQLTVGPPDESEYRVFTFRGNR